MQIICDENENSVSIVTEKRHLKVDCRRAAETARILEEIFNNIGDMDSRDRTFDTIELILINEDSKKQLGEW